MPVRALPGRPPSDSAWSAFGRAGCDRLDAAPFRNLQGPLPSRCIVAPGWRRPEPHGYARHDTVASWVQSARRRQHDPEPDQPRGGRGREGCAGQVSPPLCRPAGTDADRSRASQTRREVHALDRDCRTALHYAAQSYDQSTVTLLLRCAPISGSRTGTATRRCTWRRPLTSPMWCKYSWRSGPTQWRKTRAANRPWIWPSARGGALAAGGGPMLRRSPKIPSLTIFRLLRNTVRRAIWVQGSNALVAELLDLGVSPVSLNAQDFQLMLAHTADFNKANRTTGIPQQTLQVVRLIGKPRLPNSSRSHLPAPPLTVSSESRPFNCTPSKLDLIEEPLFPGFFTGQRRSRRA